MKKILFTLIVTMALFLPVISIHSAFTAAKRIHREENTLQGYESLAPEVNKLGQTYDNTAWIFNNLKNMATDSSKDGFASFLKQKVPDFVRQIPFPVEIECILTEPVTDRQHRYLFGQNLGLTKLRPGENETHFYEKNAKKSVPVINAKNIELFTAMYRKIKVYPRELTLHENQSVSHLSFRGFSANLKVILLANLQTANMPGMVRTRVKHFNHHKIGIGAWFKNSPRPFFSRHFADQNRLQKFITSTLKHAGHGELKLQWQNHLILVSRYDSQANCRYFAATPITSIPRSNLPNVFLAAMSLISCIWFKYILEKLFLGRGYDFSIKALLPLFFLFLLILPIFAGTGFFVDYLNNSYNWEKNKIHSSLTEDLNEKDIQSLDFFKSTLDQLRSFNSVEEIGSFSKKIYKNNDAEFICDFLNQLEKEGFKGISACLVPIGKDAVKTIFSKNRNAHFAEKVDNPLTRMFVWRAHEMFKEKKFLTEPETEKRGESLKVEIARDFLLKIIGSEGYYKFRQNNEPLFSAESKFRKNYYLLKIIFRQDRPFAYVVWEYMVGTSNDVLPSNQFKSSPNSPRLAFAGDYSGLRGHYEEYPTLQKKYPDLVKLSHQAHLTRSRVSNRIETASQTIIMEARPGNSTIFIFAGSEKMENYPAFSARILRQVAGLLASVVIISIFLAWAGALYFTVPLQKLTEATGQIHAGNFSIRIDTEHPDEFKNINASFNAMAHSLEEGEKLKSYVSGSVIREVTDSAEFTTDRSEARQATIIFSSINDFKNFQSRHSATEVFALLQTHLQIADAAVGKFGGEIDKMIEDKVMIVFEEDSNANVVARAIRIAEQIADEMQVLTEAKVSIGINSGLIIAGIMGAESARLSRTVVGDPVNLAARLAYVASQQPNGGIVISGNLKSMLPVGFSAETLPIRHVKGKTQEVEACLVSRQKS